MLPDTVYVLVSPVPIVAVVAAVPAVVVGPVVVSVYCSPWITPTPAAVPVALTSNAVDTGEKPRVQVTVRPVQRAQ